MAIPLLTDFANSLNPDSTPLLTEALKVDPPITSDAVFDTLSVASVNGTGEVLDFDEELGEDPSAPDSDDGGLVLPG